MKKTIFVFALFALAGCGGEGSGSGAPAASGSPTQKPAAAATSAAAAATSAAPAATPAAAAGGAYKGIKEGTTAIAFLKDPADPGLCGVLTAKPEEKDKLTEDKIKEIAKMVKGEVTATCPTDNIVGACRAFGIAEQYYGPKYTAETAKKDCKGVWVD